MQSAQRNFIRYGSDNIQSLLDTDLYKFTMLQVVLHKFPQTHSVYHFRCRNLEDTVYPLTDILDDLNQQLDYFMPA